VPLLEGIDLTGLVIAVVLPWVTGVALLGCFMPGLRPTVLLGHGYMIGQLAVILVLLAIDAVGLSMAFAPVAASLGLLALAAAVAWWLRSTGVVLRTPDRYALGHLLWLIPLSWFLFERGSVLTSELMLRPLYDWDSWMNWVPKAVVWFHHATLTPFVSAAEWLQSGADAGVYTLGNLRAAEYPPGVPLLLLWVMLGAGTADHTLLYLPWLLLPVSLALALWGHLRSHAAAPWLAALAMFAWLSQPLPNTHAALGGYADPWLAVAFCLGVLALDEWQRAGGVRHAVLALAMAVACALFKVPGLAFACMLVAGVAVVAWRPAARMLGWSTIVAGFCLAVGLVAGMWVGVTERGDPMLALEMPGVLPTLRLQLTPFLPYLGQTMFVYANWHMLWLLVIVAFAFGLVTTGRRAFSGVAPQLFFAALCFLVFVFGFTHYFFEVDRGITFHRAMSYLSPLAVFVAFQRLSCALRADGDPVDSRI
jgi:hypothetical protein